MLWIVVNSVKLIFFFFDIINSLILYNKNKTISYIYIYISTIYKIDLLFVTLDKQIFLVQDNVYSSTGLINLFFGPSEYNVFINTHKNFENRY